MTLVIRLPFPNPALFPNKRAGKSWKASHEAKVESREWARKATNQALEAMNQVPEYLGSIPVSIVFVAPDKRRRDLDGCLSASKHALDGMAKALKVDDSRFKPILINYIQGDKPGAMLVAVGVQITTTQVIE